MADLVLSGNTSGAITISAPAVAGTNTLTLPAQTATLATLTTPSFATTIGVGGATASASGAGISFPATQSASSDANTLDDYEEGTWTPVPAPVSGSITSYTTANTSYTKIGRFVQATARVTITNVGTASSYLTISGLPFTAGSTFQLPSIVREGGLTGNIYQGYIDGGGTTVTVQTLTGSAPTYSNNMSLSLNMIYFV
jgi:hypothetical protein